MTLIQSSPGSQTKLVIAVDHLRDVSSKSGLPRFKKPNELITGLMIAPLGFTSITEFVRFYRSLLFDQFKVVLLQAINWMLLCQYVTALLIQPFVACVGLSFLFAELCVESRRL